MYFCFALLISFLNWNWSLAHANSDTLRIGMMDSRPFYWKENGKPTGFHFEIAQALADKMKLQLQIKEAPILRIIKMLKKGDVDIVIVTDHKELEAMNAKKELILELNSYIYTLANQPITSKKEIKGNIARLSNSCSSLETHPGIEWVDAESYEQAYGLLKLKRIRGVCGTIAFQIVVNKKSPMEPNNIKPFLISKRALWAQARPDYNSERWADIQKNINELIKEGFINTQAKKFSK